jgi:mercuric ion transport protein
MWLRQFWRIFHVCLPTLWIGNLTLLEPYRPIFIAIVLLFFGWAGWKVHRPIEACEPGTACAIPQTRKRRQIIFWITGIIALVLVTSTYWIPLIASDIE